MKKKVKNIWEYLDFTKRTGCNIKDVLKEIGDELIYKTNNILSYEIECISGSESLYNHEKQTSFLFYISLPNCGNYRVKLFHIIDCYDNSNYKICNDLKNVLFDSNGRKEDDIYYLVSKVIEDEFVKDKIQSLYIIGKNDE